MTVPAPDIGPAGPAGRAAELRLAFQRSFTEPQQAGQAPPPRLLAIRAGGEPWAVRLGELAAALPGA